VLSVDIMRTEVRAPSRCFNIERASTAKTG
jgi:hypothetical protein